MRRILVKMSFCAFAFSAGLAWGIANEAAEAGIPLSQLFAG